MPKKKMAPLLVIATKTPEAIGEYALAKFTGADGDYIANASLDYRHDPYSGAEVESANGVPVEVKLDPDAMMGIKCPGCSVINSMPLEQAAKRDSVNCLVCGVANDYDSKVIVARLAELAGEDADEDEDEDEEIVIEDVVDDTDDEDDDGEEEGDDLDDDDLEIVDDEEEDEDEEDAGDSESDDSEEDEAGEDEDEGDDTDEDVEAEDDEGDDTDDSDETSEVACLDLVSPETDEFAFALKGKNTVVAFIGDLAVAKLEGVEADAANRFVSAGFANAFNKAVASSSVEAALKVNGFKPISVDIANHMLAERDRQTASLQETVGDAVTEQVERVIHCVDTVSAGAMCGMYADSGVSQLYQGLTKTLKDLNVANASSVAKSVLGKHLAPYNKGLITEAIALAGKGDTVIETVRDTIKRFDATAFNIDDDDQEESEADESPITARLKKPAKASTRKDKEVATVENKPTQFKGLFANAQ